MITKNSREPRSMRTGILVLALALSLAAVAGATDAAQGPRISVSEPLYDFGAVTAGVVLEHVFEIKNTGDAVLEIRKVAPT